MSRTAVTDESGTYAGHFDWGKASRWSDRDYNNNGSHGTGRGEAVMLTAGGKWVLETWTIWQGEQNTYAWITPDEAKVWLIRNQEDDAVSEHFSDEPEEVDLGGRPAIGGAVHVRLGDLLPSVDEYAEDRGVKRAEAVRQLVERGLTETWGDGNGGDRQTLEFSYRGGTISGAQGVIRQATPGGHVVPTVMQAGQFEFQVTAGPELIAVLRAALEDRDEECVVSEAE